MAGPYEVDVTLKTDEAHNREPEAMFQVVLLKDVLLELVPIRG